MGTLEQYYKTILREKRLNKMKFTYFFLAFVVVCKVSAKPSGNLSFTSNSTSDAADGKGASNRFFWCEILEISQLYQSLCSAGCATHSCDEICTVSGLFYSC